jgi:hypothetical protein
VRVRAWLNRHAVTSARPFPMADESIRDARAFLTHPLSIVTDSRLVNFAELQMIRRE